MITRIRRQGLDGFVAIISVALPGGIDLRLGNAGRVFLAGALSGHFGRIGNFKLWVPPATRNITLELGRQ